MSPNYGGDTILDLISQFVGLFMPKRRVPKHKNIKMVPLLQFCLNIFMQEMEHITLKKYFY